MLAWRGCRLAITAPDLSDDVDTALEMMIQVPEQLSAFWN